MQTNFRGRDFIGDLDFSKEEVETVLDVAWDLKRKRALREPTPYLRDKALAMLFFSAAHAHDLHLRLRLFTWGRNPHLSKAAQPRYLMAIRNEKWALSWVAFTMESPSGM